MLRKSVVFEHFTHLKCQAHVYNIDMM